MQHNCCLSSQLTVEKWHKLVCQRDQLIDCGQKARRNILPFRNCHYALKLHRRYAPLRNQEVFFTVISDFLQEIRISAFTQVI